MKKTLLVLAFCMMASAPQAYGQLIWEISPIGGWRIGGDFKYTTFTELNTLSFDVESSPSFGLNAAVGVTPQFFLEFQWDRQVSNLSFSRNIPGLAPDMQPKLDLTIDYYHGAFVFQYPYGQMQPYALFSLGATTFYPGDIEGGIGGIPGERSSSLGNQTKFSLGAAAGFKYYFTKQVGFRGQARFTSSSMNSEAGGIWCDFYGCWSTTKINYLTQWSFTGGLVVRFESQ